MSTLTFETEVKVFLDGRHVGTVRYDQLDRGYRYWPKGAPKGSHGELYQKLEDCLASLR